MIFPAPRRDGRAVVLASLLLAGACARPESPATAAAAPDFAIPKPGAAELSRFSVPLAYDFSSMLKVIEKVVPTSFGSMDSVRMIGTDERRHYAFHAKRGRFTAFAEGRELHLRATVEYEARGYYKPFIGPTISAGCGGDDLRPRITLELATPLTLTRSWHLSSRARLVKLEPASALLRDRCDVGILHKDVTEQVVDAARSAISSNLPAIDRKVGEVSLESKFQEWWALLARPIQLTDGVWLMLGPERLRMGKVSGRDRILTIPVTLDARPRVVTGSTAPAPPQITLPPLAQDTVSNGFHVSLDGNVDYGTASRALTAAFAQKSLQQAGKTIRVESVSVAPAEKGQLALSLFFTGDAAGTLRLVGTPKYDAKRGELIVPDLDYALAVNDKLIHTYAWLRSEQLRESFREKAHFPVASALERGRALLLEGLNRKIGDAVTLSATVDSVAVRGLYVTLDGLVVRAEASGNARVAVAPR